MLLVWYEKVTNYYLLSAVLSSHSNGRQSPLDVAARLSATKNTSSFAYPPLFSPTWFLKVRVTVEIL